MTSMPLEESTEMALIDKPETIADFLDGEIGVLQKSDGFLYDAFGYQCASRFALNLTAYCTQVFGRNANS